MVIPPKHPKMIIFSRKKKPMGLLGKPTILGFTPACCQRGMNPALASGEDETQHGALRQSDQSWGWVGCAEMGTNPPGFGLPTQKKKKHVHLWHTKNCFNKKTPRKNTNRNNLNLENPLTKMLAKMKLGKPVTHVGVWLGFPMFLSNPVTARPSLTLERQGWATRRARGPCSCQLPGLPKAPAFAWHGLPKGNCLVGELRWELL